MRLLLPLLLPLLMPGQTQPASAVPAATVAGRAPSTTLSPAGLYILGPQDEVDAPDPLYG